jgi:hypothetical protein
MNLYNGVCYPDMTALSNAVTSQPASVNGSAVVYDSLVSISGNSATFSNSLGSYTRTFSTCTDTGPMITNTMMTPAAAVELSGLIAVCWVTAWAITLLRRTL